MAGFRTPQTSGNETGSPEYETQSRHLRRRREGEAKPTGCPQGMSEISPTDEPRDRISCLIVDDDPGDRQLCQRFMAASFACDFLEAESAERGLHSSAVPT